MFRFMVVAAIAGVVLGQGHYNSDPRTAAILSEQRYLSGDGKFGAAYNQEDGTNFKEETDADGTRHGSYSYIDPSGQRRTISYTAGKNGFQASGDHLPQAPPAPPQVAPQPQYQPQQQYQSPQQYQAPRAYNSGNDNYDSEGQYDPRYNDPNFSGNQQARYQAPQQPQPAYNPPQPAYNPPQPAYNPTPQPQYQPQYQQPSYQPPQPQYTTESPHRFHPPGKLSLNRTPDGFSYSFNKVK